MSYVCIISLKHALTINIRYLTGWQDAPPRILPCSDDY